MYLQEGLSDLTVLEVGSTVVGPYTTQALGAMGANVVKIEAPGGDSFRRSTPQSETGLSGYFAMCNAGKQSVRLDLKQDGGLEAFYSLVEDADVVVVNLSPDVPDRLGIAYDDLTETTADLIYCSITGFGTDGPWSERPAYDPILQGASGLMSVTGPKGGPPVRIGVAIIDLVTGLWAIINILNALRVRDRTGEGRHITMNMFEVGMSLLTKQATMYLLTGQVPQPMGTEDIWAMPYGAYPTRDDRQLIIGAATQPMWVRLCQLIGREDLLDDVRFRTRPERVEHRSELNEILEAEFRTRPRSEWVDLLANELPVGPVLNVQEAVESTQAAHDGVMSEVAHGEYGSIDLLNLPIRTTEERHAFESPPPALGEHSRDVLKAAGYTEAELDELETDGVI